jgi:hypothetical protein
MVLFCWRRYKSKPETTNGVAVWIVLQETAFFFEFGKKLLEVPIVNDAMTQTRHWDADVQLKL